MTHHLRPISLAFAENVFIGKRARKLRGTQVGVNPWKRRGPLKSHVIYLSDKKKLAGDFSLSRLILRHVEPENDKDRDHTAAGRRFSGMVSSGHPRGGTGRAIGRARLHGDSPVGLRDLGKYAASTRCDVSRQRPSQCLLPAFYSAQLFREGSGTRRRLRQGMCRGHAYASGGGR